MQSVLHITNGDCAVDVMRCAGISGDIVPWRDVLHEGPVPADLSLNELSKVRAEYIASKGWGDPERIRADFIARDDALIRWREYDRVTLWFEHDLYDQLQLLQILDWFAGQAIEPERLTLICTEHYLGPLQPEQLTALSELEQIVGDEHLQVAKMAWKAFRSETPKGWLDLLRHNTSVLPFLSDAVIRLLEEYPCCSNGLSRIQEQVLRLISAGEISPGRLFADYQETESARFLGDVVFWEVLQQMLDSDPPLMKCSDGSRLKVPVDKRQKLTITPAGIEILSGEKNWLDCHWMDRWLGGVHLTPDNLWYWDRDSQRLRNDFVKRV